MVLHDAKKARELTNAILNNNQTNEFVLIAKEINKAIKEGKDSVFFSMITFSTETISELEKKGYKVSIGGRYNEVNTRISW